MAGADTVTMTLFHAALRRDLQRTRVLLEDPGDLSVRRRRRLGRHLQWAMAALRWHHEGEDHDLWPLLLERDPASRGVLEAMEAEHHAIDEPLLQLKAAARGLVAGRAGRVEALAALDALEGPLGDHLAHEEGDGMAIATRVLSQQDWKDFEQRAWIEGYTAVEVARFLSWICDGADWDAALRRRVGLPAPLYWAMVKPLLVIARVPGLSPWEVPRPPGFVARSWRVWNSAGAAVLTSRRAPVRPGPVQISAEADGGDPRWHRPSA